MLSVNLNMSCKLHLAGCCDYALSSCWKTVLERLETSGKEQSTVNEVVPGRTFFGNNNLKQVLLIAVDQIDTKVKTNFEPFFHLR